MIQFGWARVTVNDGVSRIRRMFKWAAENELVPPSVYHGLQAVGGLKRGRSEARETDPVRPVADDVVDATIKHLPPVVAAMVELQRITGMRLGELITMRGCDLDTSGKLWSYHPERHKTQHHGHERIVYLGPKAQGIIRPYMKTDLNAFLFSPSESEESRNAGRRSGRKSPMTPSQSKRRRERRRARPRGNRYDAGSYRRCISRACEKAFPVPDGMADDDRERWRKSHDWWPHQLRHTAAARLRREFGIEAARVVLGHRSAGVTELYAEADRSRAAQVMERVG